jgi:hypothetical protein
MNMNHYVTPCALSHIRCANFENEELLFKLLLIYYLT